MHWIVAIPVSRFNVDDAVSGRDVRLEHQGK